MNSLQGKINQIQTSGSLSIISVNVESFIFKSIIIETPESSNYLIEGNNIQLLFKETEVVIGKNEPVTSIQNQIFGKILQINSDDLLSKVVCETAIGKISAIITTEMVVNLKLIVGEIVVILVNSTEIMLSE